MFLRDDLRVWWEPRFDGQVSNDEEKEDHEGGGAHGPAVADLRDQMANHDWEDDAAETGAGREDAHGEAAAGGEPAVDGCEGWLEDQ